MQMDLRTVAIKPLRNTFGHVARRLGADKSASRYQEGTLDLQATANQHYRPLWDPEHEYFDERRTALVMTDWYAFKDPRQYYYGSYVMARARQQEAAEGAFDFVESRRLIELAPPEAVALAKRILTPLRHAAWGSSMNNDFAAAYGYGAGITQPALLYAMDQLGIAQFITRAALLMGDPADLDAAKADWMDNPAWQPLRRLVEDLFVEKDWFELFVAQDLLLDGLLYPLVYQSIIDGKLASEGGSAVAMMTQFQAEWYAETAKWVDAQIKTAVSESGANQVLVTGWIAKWKSRAIASLLPIAEMAFGEGGQSALDEVVEQLDRRIAKLGAGA
jgi:phenol/toluene 2-monooxygenase (NADH) P1/A1